MNLRSNRYFGRNRVRLAAITVLAPALGITLASAASAAPEVVPSCPLHHFCTWQNAGYSGTEWQLYLTGGRETHTWWFVGSANDQISSYHNFTLAYTYIAKDCLADSQWTYIGGGNYNPNLAPNKWPDGSGINDSISAFAIGVAGQGVSFPAHGSRTEGGC
jgi:hypothetical protein